MGRSVSIHGLHLGVRGILYTFRNRALSDIVMVLIT